MELLSISSWSEFAEGESALDGGTRGGDRTFRQVVRRRLEILASETAGRLRSPWQADAIGVIAAAPRLASMGGLDARIGDGVEEGDADH